MSRLRFILSVVALSTYFITINVDGFKDMANFSKYEDVRGDIRRNNLRPMTCRNVKLWIIHRHGTRLPMSDEIKQIQSLIFLKDVVLENHKRGRGNLTREELNRLKSWTFDASMEAIPAYLTESGAKETHRTAMRFKEKFPELLDVKYSNETFYIRHSDSQRTTATTNAFVDALFGENAHQDMDIKVEAREQDFLLYTPHACDKLRIVSEESFDAVFNSNWPFYHSEEYTSALKGISNRLGFEDTLDVLNLTAIFGACAYDSAWYQETMSTGAWCAALDPTSVAVGEYVWDLMLEGFSGYNSEASSRAYCGPIKDVYERFSKVVEDTANGEEKHSVVGLFSHDNVILGMHTVLGLLKDDPLPLGDNFALQHNRKFRSSNIVPFASNIAAILQDCRKPNGEKSYEVILLRNERPWTDITLCPKGICTWDNFKTVFGSAAEKCNYAEFC